VFALMWSTFLGLYASDSLGKAVAPEDTKWKPGMWKGHLTPGIIREFVLNFAGSLIGWMAVFYLWAYRLRPGLVATPQTLKLDATDLVVAIVAILGIFGYLPFTAFKTPKLSG